MKKLGIGLTISAAVLGGFVIAQSMISGSAATQTAESTKLITEKEAKEIALKKFNGTITEVDFDQDNQHPHYEFEIQSNNKEVNIDVDAKTGKATITESELAEKENSANTKPVQNNQSASKEQDDDEEDDVKTAPSQPAAAKPSSTKQQETETSNQTNAAKTQTAKPNSATTQKAIITKAEAIKIASTVAKGTLTNVELDSDDDDQTKTYELDFKDGNVEYDVEVDAYTGKIIEVNQDIED